MSTNASAIAQQCTERSSIGTPKQEAKCICELTNSRISGCSDVAVTNMTWRASESVSCDQESLTDPKFLLRCFNQRFETEVV